MRVATRLTAVRHVTLIGLSITTMYILSLVHSNITFALPKLCLAVVHKVVSTVMNRNQYTTLRTQSAEYTLIAAFFAFRAT